MKFNIFSRWSTSQTGIIIFDPDNNVLSPLSKLNPETKLLQDPFWVYTHIIEEVARLQEPAVWAIRNELKTIEQLKQRPLRADYRKLDIARFAVNVTETIERPKPREEPRPDYRQLHNIARHAIHVTETLDTGLKTLEHILRQHGSHIGQTYASQWGMKENPAVWQAIHARLAFFQSYLGSIRHRSISNEKRLQNEIQLSFNMVAQHDAAVTVEISRAMMSDSAALKALAFITFMFLPPTFICAIFSMSFFDYSVDSGWTVSRKFWVYWASALPTIAATVLLWLCWNRIPPQHSPKSRTAKIPWQQSV